MQLLEVRWVWPGRDCGHLVADPQQAGRQVQAAAAAAASAGQQRNPKLLMQVGTLPTAV